MAAEKCEATLKDPVLCEILHYVAGAEGYEVTGCTSLSLTISVRRGRLKIVLDLTRTGNFIAYLAIIKRITNPDDLKFAQFKSLIGNPNYRFHPGEYTKKSGRSKTLFAVARCDSEATNYDTGADAQYTLEMMNLWRLLRDAPSGFLD